MSIKNELIKEFLDKQSYIENLKHEGKSAEDCRYKVSYDCKLCAFKRLEAKGEFIFRDLTDESYMNDQLIINKYTFIKERTIEEIKSHLLKNIIHERNILIFLKNYGEEKTKDIIKTIELSQDNKYFKITDKMKFCLSINLMSLVKFEEISQLFIKK